MKFLTIALAAMVSLGTMLAPAEARVHGGAEEPELIYDTAHETGDRQPKAAAGETQVKTDKQGTGRVSDLTEAKGPIEMKMWPVTTHDEGGVLLFSDCPEYVSEDGILYSDVVNGPARVFYYHVNETKENKKIAVILENQSEHLCLVKVTKEALSWPDENYWQVGKSTQEIYLKSDGGDDVLLLGKQRKLLSRAMDMVIKPDKLVEGIYDFETNQPVRVTVLMYPANANPLDFVTQAKVLPKDSHRLRGTYQGKDRVIKGKKAYNPDKDGPVYIILADEEVDGYKQGVDATDGSITENYGNYGVMYKLQLATTGKSEIQYYINPLGGYFGGYVAAQKARQENWMIMPVPRYSLTFGTQYGDDGMGSKRKQGVDYLTQFDELEDIGLFPAKEQLSFIFSPPGASCLPVNFVLIPARKDKGLAYK